MYSPMWNEIQPQFNFTITGPTRKCVSTNINTNMPVNYGWKLIDCTNELPVICETFGCIKGLL